MKKNKIILISTIIILFFLCIFAILKIKNYIAYKKILSIINNAKEQVSIIDNVSILEETMVNGKKIDGIENKIVIKDLKQCDTNNRKIAEENGISYRLLDFKNNICYTINPYYNDKKIYIENIEYQKIHSIELLEYLIVPQYSFMKSITYKIDTDIVDNKECYNVTINEKKEEIYEYSYWIEKESGLLIKKDLKYYANIDNVRENNLEESIYYYSFDIVTDEEVREINFEEYSNYKIVDER